MNQEKRENTRKSDKKAATVHHGHTHASVHPDGYKRVHEDALGEIEYLADDASNTVSALQCFAEWLTKEDISDPHGLEARAMMHFVGSLNMRLSEIAKKARSLRAEGE